MQNESSHNSRSIPSPASPRVTRTLNATMATLTPAEVQQDKFALHAAAREGKTPIVETLLKVRPYPCPSQ